MVFYQTQDAEKTCNAYVEKAEIWKSVARQSMVEAVKKTLILVRRTKEMYPEPPNKSLEPTP